MKQRLIKFIVTAVILIVAVFVIININMKNREVPESLFYTYDSKDRVIKGHYSESENIWYLFITSDMECENTDIYSLEEIEGAEFGSVNSFLNRVENSFRDGNTATKIKTPSGVSNRESFVSSFYWYKDGESDVIHLGPIWDFNTSMGNDYTNVNENYGKDHIMFKYLLSGEEFYNKTVDIYKEFNESFKALSDKAYIIKAEIESSANMNYKRWDVLGSENPKGSTDYSESFDEAVESIVNWLDGRYEAFKIENTDSVSSVVSDDCYTMDVTFESKTAHERVKIAVWSIENDNDDLNWYDAYKVSDNLWQCTVDLTMHNSSGIYRIAVYGEDLTAALTAGYSYVETATEPLYKMQAINAENNKSFDILLEDSGLHNEMRFAVWSDEDAQDDLIWYEAKKNSDNSWAASVKFENHPGKLIHVHAYSEIDGVSEFIYSISFEVSFS